MANKQKLVSFRPKHARLSNTGNDHQFKGVKKVYLLNGLRIAIPASSSDSMRLVELFGGEGFKTIWEDTAVNWARKSSCALEN